jgi:hypothetical protein
MLAIQIERNDIKLSSEEVKYWKRMFRSNLKIGVELEAYIDSSLNPDNTRSEMTSLFTPTNNVGKFGSYGVYAVKHDGSIQHGFELCTVGRRPDFLDLYYQYDAITSLVIDKYKAFINQRCGLHNHVLLDYTGDVSSLEKPVPGIVFKNFVQLLRRYMPELVYITSTMKHERYITRFDSFCSADTLIKYTPIARTISDYQDKINSGSDDRYKFLNMKPMRADGDDIKRFHFELRFPDGSIYPMQIAAQNMLYTAMLIKAVELSELGIISTGTPEEWAETKLLYGLIRNTISDRYSSCPNSETLGKIQQRAFDMLLELKPQLDQYDAHVYGVLYYLTTEPISLMRRRMTDIEINDEHKSIVSNMYSVDLSDCTSIIEMITLQQITKCYSRGDYESRMAKALNTSVNDIQKKLFKLNNNKPIDFDIVLGAMKFK